MRMMRQCIPSCCDINKTLICNEFCIDINQESNEKKVYWKAIDTVINGSICVENTSNIIMKIIIGTDSDDIVEYIDPNHSLVLTVTHMNSIEIEFCGDNRQEYCSGCLQVTIHMLCDFKKKKKKCYCQNNRIYPIIRY